jgi:hypothetical protein
MKTIINGRGSDQGQFSSSVHNPHLILKEPDQVADGEVLARTISASIRPDAASVQGRPPVPRSKSAARSQPACPSFPEGDAIPEMPSCRAIWRTRRLVSNW